MCNILLLDYKKKTKQNNNNNKYSHNLLAQ